MLWFHYLLSLFESEWVVWMLLVLVFVVVGLLLLSWLPGVIGGGYGVWVGVGVGMGGWVDMCVKIEECRNEKGGV